MFSLQGIIGDVLFYNMVKGIQIMATLYIRYDWKFQFIQDSSVLSRPLR